MHSPSYKLQDGHNMTPVAIIETIGFKIMRRSRKRLFDAGLMILGILLAIVVLRIALLCGATSRELATCVISWVMLSLPLAMLIGHCALGEE